MNKRLETQKYTFTVEGETERWYLNWLKDEINRYDGRSYNVSFDVKVQPCPRKFYKGINAKITPIVTHICDVESNELEHENKFKNILLEMNDAKKQKKIGYILGYSNFTFELWMVLHKVNCFGALNHRNQYLDLINKSFGENFNSLDQYKREDNFKHCLDKLSINDVFEAIKRADMITANNVMDEKILIRYKGYSYYRDNPALSIHHVVRTILKECGIN